MRHGPLVFLGLFLAMAISWAGLVLYPQMQIGNQPVAVLDDSTGQAYPIPRPGLAREGLDVYRANGCVYCHSQQVRYQGFGADFERGWGKRWSVDRDYLYDSPVMLGEMRIGPDLANIGVRRGNDTNQVNLTWHLLHLYNPRINSPGSMMPAYPYLFAKRKVGDVPSPNALKLTGEFAPENGYEIVPRQEALALVNYLFSLQSETPLFESSLPPSPKPKTPRGAAAGGASTNSPAK